MSTEKKRNIIGPQVEAARVKKGMQQKDLAIGCNLLSFDISRSGISKIEMGIRQVTDLEIAILARALEVEVADLFPQGKLPLWQSRKTWRE